MDKENAPQAYSGIDDTGMCKQMITAPPPTTLASILMDEDEDEDAQLEEARRATAEPLPIKHREGPEGVMWQNDTTSVPALGAAGGGSSAYVMAEPQSSYR
jgi:hypothetical protein